MSSQLYKAHRLIWFSTHLLRRIDIACEHDLVHNNPSCVPLHIYPVPGSQPQYARACG
jgi:hypothetical protein